MDLPCVHTRICTNKNVSTVTLLKRDLHIWKETYKRDLCTWRTCLPHGVLQDVSVLQSHTHDGVRLLHAELQCVAGFRSNAHMQECVSRTMCCSVFQCVAVCCSVLQCVAVCCSCAHRIQECVYRTICCSVLQRVAVCCSVLQCVAVCFSCAHRIQECVYRTICCSVLQCVAVCLSYTHHIQEYVQRPRLTCHVWHVSACVSILHARWKQRCVCTHVARSSKHVCSRHISCLQCVAACSVFWLSICLVCRNQGAFSCLSFIMQLTPYMNATDFVFWRHPWLLQKSGSSKNIIIRNWRRSSKSWEVSNSTHALRVFYKTNLIHLN
jgi:hypothetical protein